MRTTSIDADFADLLTPKGRALLAGRGPLAGALANPRTRYLSADGLLDARKAARLRVALEKELGPALEPLEQPIPPESIWEMTRDYGELLPKAMRVRTAYLEHRSERGWKAAEAMGLLALLRSASFHAFAEALAGRPLDKAHGVQALRYGPGDYSGPHNDHHPEEPRARAGYIDVHLSLASPSTKHQWLNWARAGHLTEMVDLARPALVSAYRLPLWHQVTPLVAKRGRIAQAHRWVLLGTFLYR